MMVQIAEGYVIVPKDAYDLLIKAAAKSMTEKGERVDVGWFEPIPIGMAPPSKCSSGDQT